MIYIRFRRLQNYDYLTETKKVRCDLIHIDYVNKVKYFCEFDSIDETIQSAELLEVLESNSGNYNITNLEILNLLYQNNLVNVPHENFTKPLFVLYNSEIMENRLEFNITGSLLENELDFNYQNLFLQYSLESETKNIVENRNETCFVFNLNQSEYGLQCKPNKNSIGNVITAFSDLGDANLVVLFKNKENLINIDRNQGNRQFFFKKNNSGLSTEGILAIKITCLVILVIIIGLIIYLKSNKKKEMHSPYSESTNIPFKI